jgi:uncharacterized protein YndB with AHSA1/START domain
MFWKHSKNESSWMKEVSMERPSLEEKIAPVRKSIEVRCNGADAFRIFTEDIHTWWPLETHSISGSKATRCAFESKAGGEIYEEDQDGVRHIWGSVRVWEPPRRIVFSWHLGRGEEVAQEVEIRFEESGEGTRVELEHRDWEVFGTEAESKREQYNKGWELVLGRYLDAS